MKVLLTQKIIGIAGSENYLLQLANGLVKRNIEVEFLSLVPKRLKGQEVAFNQRLLEMNVTVFTIYYSFPFLGALSSIAKLIKSNNYNIVHSHLIHADLLMALAKKFYTSFKLVSSKHGYQEWYNNKYGFDPKFRTKNVYWKLAKWAEKQIDRSFAISQGLRSLYIGLDICNRDRLDLIYYGFNFPSIINTGRFRFSKNQLVIVGRLTAFKGHRYAFEVIDQLKEKIHDVLLVVVGSGSLESELKEIVKEKSLSKHIKFMGYNSNGREIMGDSDVVLIPSIAEGFGVVVLEAFSSSKPIVAFDVPSLNEHIVNDHSGILINPYSTDEYALAVEGLLKNKTKASNVAFNGNKKLQRDYNFDSMMDQTIKFYHKVIY